MRRRASVSITALARSSIQTNYTQVLDDHRVLQSVGSVGDAYDNAMAESFVDSFFVGLLFEEARGRRRTVAAGGGAGIALVLSPLVPPGLPILAAAAAAIAVSRVRS